MKEDNLLYSTIEEYLEKCHTDEDFAEWARNYANKIIMTYKEVDKLNFDYYCQLKKAEVEQEKNKILLQTLKILLPVNMGIKIGVDNSPVVVINKNGEIEAIEDKEEYKLEYNRLFKLSDQ